MPVVPSENERVDAAVPLIDGLNPDQLDAVVHTDGPLLVVAGAGSGKTRVLTHRIAHLVGEHGVNPMRILAITFTNKAADEMRERVASLVGPVARKMWVSTFHSACVRILRREAAAIGYPSSFSIYDQADAQRLTGYVIRDLALDPKRFTPKGVHAQISQYKNDLIFAAEARERAANIFERKTADIYTEYQARLVKAGAMDFDDLLTNAVRLFREHPDVLAQYQERFEHILVDEYQDTNRAQNELILTLGAVHRNVCVVGDSDQSIYRFRGADLRNILEFEEAFPDVTVIVLEQNYRSTQTILDAANAVIENNASRKPKQLWTEAGRGDRIVRYHADDADVAVAGGEHGDELVLGAVGVLELVDEDVLEALLVVQQHVGVLDEEPDRLGEQVVEVHGPGLQQPRLVLAVHLGDAALEDRAGPVGVVGHRHELVLRRADGGLHPPGREALGVDVLVAQHVADEAHGVGLVVDRERRREAEGLAVASEDAHARRVERRHPHLLGHRPDEGADAVLHLVGGLVGEGDGEDLERRDALLDEVGYAMGEHPRLARTGAGDHEQGAARVDDGLRLVRVEPGEEVVRRAHHRPTHATDGV